LHGRAANPRRQTLRFLAVVVLVLAVLAVVPATATAADVLKVTPGTVNFGSKPVGSSTAKATTITNTSDEAISLSLALVRSWDDFAGPAVESTCPGFEPGLLQPGESCTLMERFFPSETFLGIKQDQIWLASATDPQSGAVLDREEIVFFGRAR
jgi:hypothetical protein